MQSQTSRCLASPNGPSPRNTHWRYRLEKAGQRCWYLAGLSSKRSPATRTRTSLSNKSNRPKKEENQRKKNDLKQLRSVANTNDSLLASNSASPRDIPASPRDIPNAGRTDQSEGSLNEAPPPNFDARWLASPPANQSVALSKVAPAIPPDIQSPARTDNSLTANPTAVDFGDDASPLAGDRRLGCNGDGLIRPRQWSDKVSDVEILRCRKPRVRSIASEGQFVHSGHPGTVERRGSKLDPRLPGEVVVTALHGRMSVCTLLTEIDISLSSIDCRLKNSRQPSPRPRYAAIRTRGSRPGVRRAAERSSSVSGRPVARSRARPVGSCGRTPACGRDPRHAIWRARRP